MASNDMSRRDVCQATAGASASGAGGVDNMTHRDVS